MFSRYFIDRPILASVPSIIITLAGLVAERCSPAAAQYPEITPPTVRVSCTYPGASAQVVADTVAAPIEQQVNGVEDMLYMSSQCSNDGTYQSDRDVQGGHRPEHGPGAGAEPRGAGPAHAARRGQADRRDHEKRSPDLMLVVNLISPDGRYDQLYLSNYALMQVRDELARLDGVGDAFIFGQRDYSMRVWLDPDQLAARNMTAGDVVAALREQNVQVAAGQIGQQPASPGRRLPVHHDHARPADRARAVRRHHRQDRRPTGRSCGCATSPGSSWGPRTRTSTTTSTATRRPASASSSCPAPTPWTRPSGVKAKMEELARSAFPRASNTASYYDTTPYICESINEVFKTLRDAVLLVALVVLVFLQNWRSALIPADRRAGGHHRHLRRHGGDGVQPQHALAVRPGAGHRHRGRRRDRGGRGHRAPHRAGHDAARRRAPGHGRGLGPGDRHRAGAGLACSCPACSSRASRAGSSGSSP